MNGRRLTFAVGDIHGCLAQLETLLASIESIAAGGRVIFLGDLVDRGPDSRGVVERIMAGPRTTGWKWITLKGNHEAMLVAARKGRPEMSLWLINGGEETMASYGGAIPLSHLVWMAELPSIIIERHRIFVHAGVDENIPLDEQGDDILLWMRTDPNYSGTYWGRHVCHGHTPSRSNPRTVGNRTNVDSGAVFGGMLSCAVFDDDRAGGPIDFLVTDGYG
ncbi:serine/threonine protein phosphatase [Sinorhizobium medicae]|uniref:Bis(5'nucleosyl)-tetraphosphatase, ApaH n=2 Tax=Sinorhizobium medicae TaxID=110321 RepID=A6UIL9_SINMW|nr:metallophosphoesterase family protein [Sinorhizobium medicae]ABR63499.1 bis(5'nucleosyl)-tetraphosphatase, ApaH [Sinorhizobium medicae WSM419]MBO1941782.1 serine/threonine protein phosphatase [Sinorhizobium medicae]MDX0434234.1 serine/threonine protein phosphatase [Sinorhizobium medicae]MDX0520720.1 serine/threonine protein phosphatase [Sinorhizobium medicae]MDX0547584.1 serine/threonine protein phosphatase [Sinorhizobium medicae]